MQLTINAVWLIPVLGTWVLAGIGGRLLASVHNQQTRTGQKMKMEEIFCFLVIGLSMVLGGYFGWFLLEPK